MATDLSPLGELSNLTRLSVTANSASSFSEIGLLKALVKLHIATMHLPIAQISPRPQLAYLGIQANTLSGLSALARFSVLKEMMFSSVTTPIDLRPSICARWKPAKAFEKSNSEMLKFQATVA